MNEQELEHRLTEVEDRAKANTRRVEEVERRQNRHEELLGAVTMLAHRQEIVESDVKEIKKDVKEINAKPGKRWDTIVDKVLLTAVSAILLYIMAKLGF
jgi:seryl-tRNA synthetase